MSDKVKSALYDLCKTILVGVVAFVGAILGA